MTEPFQNDPYRNDTLHGDTFSSSATHRGAQAIPHPRTNRQLLLVVGVAILALLLALAVWQTTGTRGAKHDFANANDKVVAKEREVEAARRTLNQKIAELRVVKAEADVQAAKLGNAVEQQVGGAVGDPRLDTSSAAAHAATAPFTGPAPVYYVRDQQGRFIPVTRP
jgi:hypothetical protein